MSQTLEIPERIASLPRDDAGRPVPWFVAWVDGKPEFRAIGPGKREEAYAKRKCWVCGQQLGRYLVFVIGPMCALNRISSEPPSHKDCAIFSAKACPFLSTPRMHRRTRDLPEGVSDADGLMIKRNPAVSLLWVTRSYWPFSDQMGGFLFRLGPPEQTLWFREGRPASRNEILESIEGGLVEVRKVAETEGAIALRALEKSYQEALALLPAA
jgi:hypothetical protein